MAVTPPLMFHVHGFEPQDLSNFEENVSGTLEQCGKKLLKPWALRLCPSRQAGADAMGKGIVDGATFHLKQRYLSI